MRYRPGRAAPGTQVRLRDITPITRSVCVETIGSWAYDSPKLRHRYSRQFVLRHRTGFRHNLYQYHAVPSNLDSLRVLGQRLRRLWRLVLSRRGQLGMLPWAG